MAGWVTATPAPMSAVAANSVITSDVMPRKAEPSAVSSNPATAARTAPSRPTSRGHGQRRRREQHHRNAGENADFRARVDYIRRARGDDRRYGQYRKPQRIAGEP